MKVVSSDEGQTVRREMRQRTSKEERSQRVVHDLQTLPIWSSSRAQTKQATRVVDCVRPSGSPSYNAATTPTPMSLALNAGRAGELVDTPY